MLKLDPTSEAILDLLNTSSLISAEWKIKELKPAGKCSYSFFLPRGWFISFFFEKVEDYDLIFREHLLRLKCDGILIDTNRRTFYLAEMKRHLSFPNFVKALNQLKASYLKLLSLLWLIGNFTDYKVHFFIVTDRIKKSSLDERYIWKKKILFSSQGGDFIYRNFIKLKFHKRTDWSLTVPDWYFPVRKDILRKKVTLQVLPCDGKGFI